MNTSKPTPGSVEARKAGCVCPMIDNGYGKGWHGIKGCFVIVEDCPIHGESPLTSGTTLGPHVKLEPGTPALPAGTNAEGR